AEPGGEGVHGAGGVEAAAVEAAVDLVLDAAAQGLEQGGGGQGGGGHGQAAGAAGQAGGGGQDQQGGDEQQGGDGGVGDGPGDQAVQVPQPIAQHRHRDGHRARTTAAGWRNRPGGPAHA